MSASSLHVANKIAERFMRGDVIPLDRDAGENAHGKSDDQVRELRAGAKAAGVMAPDAASRCGSLRAGHGGARAFLPAATRIGSAANPRFAYH